MKFSLVTHFEYYLQVLWCNVTSDKKYIYYHMNTFCTVNFRYCFLRIHFNLFYLKYRDYGPYDMIVKTNAIFICSEARGEGSFNWVPTILYMYNLQHACTCREHLKLTTNKCKQFTDTLLTLINLRNNLYTGNWSRINDMYCISK